MTLTLEESIFTRLTVDHTGTKGLITARCYPVSLPQEPTFPAVTYWRVSSPGQLQAFGGPVGLAIVRFQIDCWDDDYKGARALAAQVRLAMDGFSGLLGGSTGVQTSVSVEGGMDDYDPTTGWYLSSVDVVIWYAEATS